MASLAAEDGSAPPGSRLEFVDFLRGVASLSVCWFHLSKDAVDPLLRRSGSYGWLGVEVFFVVSGFVIPLSLARSRYWWHDYGRFVAKRILRLDPPYFASIVLVLAKEWGYARYKGHAFVLDKTGLLLHLAYVNALFHHAWLNPVFWTLAIEFQYYLLIGIGFPFVSHKRSFVRLAALVGVGALALLIPYNQSLLQCAFLFFFGIAVFQKRQGLVGWKGFFFLLTSSYIGCVLNIGALRATAGLVTALLLALVDARVPGGAWLGRISYSLYLVHYPVGLTLLFLGAKGMDALGLSGREHPWVVAFGSLAGCLLSAQLFHALIEGPAHAWSSRLSYRGRTRVDSPPATR